MRSFNLLPKELIGSPLLLPDHVIAIYLTVIESSPLSPLSPLSSTTTMFNSEDIKSSLKLDQRGSDYETANYPPDHDCNSSSFFISAPIPHPPLATSSGGSGSPEDAWSKSAQRGKHFPTHLTETLPNSSSSPDPYNPAYPFTPPNSSGLPITSPSTPVPTIPTTAPTDLGSDPDSWESRGEALKRLNERYTSDTKDI